MGPQAKAKGFTCLRDMVDPGAAHCLSRQPASYKDFDPTGDVHDNSGIPNRAFAAFAQNLGGNTYDMAIKVWYDACVSGLSSRATFADFAKATVAAAQIEESGGRHGGDGCLARGRSAGRFARHRSRRLNHARPHRKTRRIGRPAGRRRTRGS